jgi:hypothetical protein
MGHLIPAGTGFGDHRNVKMVEMVAPQAEMAPEETEPAVG